MITNLVNLLKLVGLLMVMLSLSCATALHPPTSSFSLDNTNSIIFGKDEVILNGQPAPIKYSGPLFSSYHNILHHISPYVSDEAINKEPSEPGEYAFRVTDDQDGYFAFVVPSGKYYFVEFDYWNVLPGVHLIGLRTYMSLEVSKKTFPEPYLMTFDVPTKRAVYIGTIRHEFHTIENNWFYFKGDYVINYSNDFESAQKWFLKSNGQFGKNIVQGTIETRPISITNKK